MVRRTVGRLEARARQAKGVISKLPPKGFYWGVYQHQQWRLPPLQPLPAPPSASHRKMTRSQWGPILCGKPQWEPLSEPQTVQGTREKGSNCTGTVKKSTENERVLLWSPSETCQQKKLALPFSSGVLRR